jgi:hypothetical protein
MTDDERTLLMAVAKVAMQSLDTPRNDRVRIQELMHKLTDKKD